MKNKRVMLSILVLLGALALGYFLPDCLATLSDRALRQEAQLHSLQTFSAADSAQSQKSSLALSKKLELFGATPYILADLYTDDPTQEGVMLDTTFQIIDSIVQHPMTPKYYSIQPSIAYFSEQESFLVCQVSVEFSEGGYISLILDSATNGILFMAVTDTCEYAEAADEPHLGENAALVQRIIDTLAAYNAMTDIHYDPQQSALTFSLGQERLTAALVVDEPLTTVIFNH